MAQLLPQTVAPPADPDAARLEATLASLPDEWMVLPDRRLGGDDGPRVAFVLIHPEIGVALVDLAPGEPAAGIAPLRALLAGERIAADGSDALPIVAVAVAADEIPAIGERLADAFGAVPPYDLPDPRWPAKLVDLLLSADDATMAPLGAPLGAPLAAAPPPRAAPVHWQPVIEPEDEPLYAEAPPRQPSRRLTLAAAGAAVVAVVAVVGIAATYLSQGPAEGPRMASFSLPIPDRPAPPLPTQAAQAAGPLSLPPAPSERGPQPLPPPPSGLASLAAPPPLPPAPSALSPPDTLPAAAQPAPPQPAAPPPAPAVAAAPAASSAALDLLPAKPSPRPAAVAKRAAKPVKKEIAAPARAKRAWKPVPALAAARAPVAPKPKAAMPAAAPDEDASAPPIDASDLPPLDAGAVSGSAVPPEQVSNLPVGSPVPLPSPFAGVPATGQPVMLLPPVAPPAAMPGAPAFGPGDASPGPR